MYTISKTHRGWQIDDDDDAAAVYPTELAAQRTIARWQRDAVHRAELDEIFRVDRVHAAHIRRAMHELEQGAGQ
jgi:hypothetical protein